MGTGLRRAEEDDWPAIWPIWHRIVAAGDTYVWSPDTAEPEARRLWMLPPPAEVWVVDEPERGIVATAVLKPSAVGLGDHVANAGFMVDPDEAGRGLGRELAEGMLERARQAGYLAMQFNAVVASNIPALRLWESLGFAVVGRVPEAFRHARLGFVDLLVMHRRL